MFIEAIIIGIIIGFVRNGRISNLSELNFKGWYLILIGFILQYLPLIFNLFNFEFFNAKLPVVGNGLILSTLLLNLQYSGLWVIIIGGAINLIGYVINGFQVLILKSAISEKMIGYIDQGHLINYKYFTAFDEWSYYFGKIIPLPDFYPVTRVLSIGDLIISVGIVVFIALEMKKIYYDNRGSMLRFSYKKNI